MLHVSHYKVACRNEDILDAHRRLLVLPFIHNFVPSRWVSTVQCMLENFKRGAVAKRVTLGFFNRNFFWEALLKEYIFT